MKSNLHAVYNDPKLNRFKETTRIQPLFKKKFDTEAPPPPLNGTLQPVPAAPAAAQPSRNMSASNLRIDPLQNRLPPTASKNSEEIYMVLQRLKAEKLEVMRDLYTYEERYEKKLSMRARLKEINRLCEELESMAESAQGQIHTEETLFEKLILGLQTFALNKMQRTKKRISGPSDLEPVQSSALWSFQVSKLISGLRCLVLCEMDGIGKDLELTVRLEETPAAFSMKVPAAEVSVRNEAHWVNAVKSSVLSTLYFHSSSSKLSLKRESAYGQQWLQLIIHLKGSPYLYSCVRISESDTTLQLHMREMLISAADMRLTIPRESIGVMQPLGKLTDFALEKLTNSLTARLALMEGEHGQCKLEWDMNEWQMEHGLYRTKEEGVGSKLSPMTPSFQTKQKYEEFNLQIHTESVRLKSHTLEVCMHFSTIAETYRLQVSEGVWTCTFHEEEFRDEFAFLKSLQFHSLQMQAVTLFRSVEFKAILLRLLRL